MVDYLILNTETAQSPAFSLIQKLRNETRKAHIELDEGVSLHDVTTSVEGCWDYMQKFTSACQEVGDALDWKSLEMLGIPDAAERQQRYKKLEVFSIAGSRQSAAAHPDPQRSQAVPIPRMVGGVYVLEGSVHGGNEIFRSLSERFPPAELEPFGFLQGFGSANAEIWRRFVLWIDGLPFSENDAQEACSAASAAFEVFKRHLLES